jgi:hypothetical protein
MTARSKFLEMNERLAVLEGEAPPGGAVDLEPRVAALEAQAADHEARIAALEPPVTRAKK